MRDVGRPGLAGAGLGLAACFRWLMIGAAAAGLAACAAQSPKTISSASLSLAAVEPAETPPAVMETAPTQPVAELPSPVVRIPVVSALGDLVLERKKAVQKVGKPYKVAGLWYVPKHQPDYDETGIASWYGPKFHGKSTANGEIYNQARLTAAHPTLPLPSYVEVTNLANGHTIMVRVNDRGPYKRGRILDLSARAAKLLGYQSNGTANVRVRYVGQAPLAGDDRYEEQFLTKQAWYKGGATTKPSEFAEVDFTASIDLGDPPAVAVPAAAPAIPSVPLVTPAPKTAATGLKRVASSK
ncbi:MAG: septal ring lytic transglycosylase RlpA family protein [Hyphomicrobiaceae bacterium]